VPEMSRAHKPQRTVNRAAGWNAINTLLIKHSTEQQDPEAANQLIAVSYASLTALVGTATSAPWLDMDGFIRLNEMNCFGFCLAKRLHQYGTQSTKASVLPSQVVFEHAAEALAAIGERFNEKQVYRATGDELKLLRESFAWLESLINVSTQGHTLTALIDAKRMIEGKLHG
jgi:hypothetical protein